MTDDVVKKNMLLFSRTSCRDIRFVVSTTSVLSVLLLFFLYDHHQDIIIYTLSSCITLQSHTFSPSFRQNNNHTVIVHSLLPTFRLRLMTTSIELPVTLEQDSLNEPCNVEHVDEIQYNFWKSSNFLSILETKWRKCKFFRHSYVLTRIWQPLRMMAWCSRQRPREYFSSFCERDLGDILVMILSLGE